MEFLKNFGGDEENLLFFFLLLVILFDKGDWFGDSNENLLFFFLLLIILFQPRKFQGYEVEEKPQEAISVAPLEDEK